MKALLKIAIPLALIFASTCYSQRAAPMLKRLMDF